MLKAKVNVKAAIFFVALVTVVGLAVYFSAVPKTENVTYIDFMKLADEGKVTEVVLSEGDKLLFSVADSKINYETDNPRTDDLKVNLLLKGIKVTESTGRASSSAAQSAVGILFFASAGFAAVKLMKKQSGAGALALKSAEITDENTLSVKFDNVAGNEEAKESMKEIVDFIKNPEKYAKLGARMPKGVIFYGAPGTGKTLMAKAVAGEAGVSFFAVSGSDFVQMYVGVGAARVRELFEKASKKGKAVIFIDEIDALGKKRGTGLAGGNDERDQTLNALLTEMSGFKSDSGTIVIAATNRLDTLDEALLRPGRFDRQIEIALPDLNGREKILELHAKEKPVDERVNLREVAKQTVYFSGAMLENLLNEAAISAAKEECPFITAKHIDDAYYTVIAGSEKKDRSGVSEHEKTLTAIHEAGHAVITKLCAPENSVAKVTIIPSTKGAGGFSVNIPKDKMFYSKKELKAQIMISLAGRAAEELVFGEENVTTGAANDIEKATAVASDFIRKFGMSEKYGLINSALGGDEKTAQDECAELIKALYSDTKNMLSDNMQLLKNIADALFEKETLSESDIDLLVYGKKPA